MARNTEVGFWVFSKHADVLAASTDPTTFCSRQGILIFEIGADYAVAADDDAHRPARAHAVPRAWCSPASPRRSSARSSRRCAPGPAPSLAELEPGVARDVVAPVTVPFPLQIIAELLGIPEDEWPRFYLWSEAVIPGATDWSDEERQSLQAEMISYLVGEAKARRDAPARRPDLGARDGRGRR